MRSITIVKHYRVCLDSLGRVRIDLPSDAIDLGFEQNSDGIDAPYAH